MSVTLILFCKKPAVGVGKQRLAASLGKSAALRIAAALHECALAQLRQWPGPKVVAVADPGDLADYHCRYPDIDRVLAQPQGNLGVRINGIDQQLRRAGMTCGIVIGSDTPEQTPAMLARAAAALEARDVVLAPASDGGVSLMASRRPWPELEALPWSTALLGEALARCCTGAGLELGWCEPCADVDRLQDLRRLKRTLADDCRPEQRALHQLLEELI
ncbi:hypothetical protein GCM10011348_02640 [Marinobacterium nitratireducens]|uniref:Glycosyltransferase n=1 Tax=Marinobacterium nitratireducens TaxID=518897 RepID=A0A917Z5U9_9GAMM|nr:DUF2064 domain-containing protein [Marinobacterium nitratireducens]GGO76140.1 hypothetical protein GCM10011348_02640 [Marinobacterium nitratireducens]